MSHRLRLRSGFTLVELLVVIAIISILLSLTLVGVMAGIESARRMQCADHLRQMAIGTQLFEVAQGRLPGWQEVAAADSRRGLEYPNALPGATTNKVVAWPIALMPHIDKGPLHERWDDVSIPKYVPDPAGQSVINSDLIMAISLFECPSRPTRLRRSSSMAYVANRGYLSLASDPAPLNAATVKGPATAGYDYWDNERGANGAFIDRVPLPVNGLVDLKRAQNVTSSNFKDGRGNTLLYSENLIAGNWWQPGADNTFVWLYATSTACPPDPGKPMPTQSILPEMLVNGSRQQVTTLGPQTARPSSQHRGGVNAAFADGHVEFIRDGIEYHVYQQLMTPDRRKSQMPCASYLLREGDYLP